MRTFIKAQLLYIAHSICASEILIFRSSNCEPTETHLLKPARSFNESASEIIASQVRASLARVQLGMISTVPFRGATATPYCLL